MRADRDGFLTRLEARRIGEAAWRLGAGRSRKEDPVSATAGVVWHAMPGDRVTRGDVLLDLHVDDVDRLPAALDALAGAIEIGEEPHASSPLVIDRISGD